MARVNIALTPLVAGGSLASPAGVTPDASDGNVVDPQAAWPASTLEEVIVKVANGATDAEMTFSAGVSPPAFEAGLGDLVVTVAADTTRYFGPFPSGRFAQADGTLHIDVDVATNVTVTAFKIPTVA